MSWSVINSELIVLLDLTTKVSFINYWGKCQHLGGWEFVPHVPSQIDLIIIFSQRAQLLVIYKNVFLTPCCQLWTFANTFVVVCILCTEMTSWLPNAAYFACCPTVAFKVYPVEWKRKNEGRGGGSQWLLSSSKGNVQLTYTVLHKCRI